MAHLSDLSAELLLSVASYLTQTDLLNISLTSQRLRAVTESELFREYVNSSHLERSFFPFIRVLIERPNLAQYVHRLEFRTWETLDWYNPAYHHHCLFDEISKKKQNHPEPSESEYMLVARAAKAAGVIDSIAPYEVESSLKSKVKAMIESDPETIPEAWFLHVFDPDVEIAQISFSQKFCQLLRAGSEDPHVVLLIHMLPKVREIFLSGTPYDHNALPWHLPRHGFGNLRKFSAVGINNDFPWPIALYNSLLEVGKLSTLETCCAGDFTQALMHGDRISCPLSLRPGSLNLTRLHLQSCYLPQGQIKILIEASPQTKSFYFSDPAEPRSEPPMDWTPANIIDTLKPLEESLEDLYVDIGPWLRVWEAPKSECIRSLRSFSKLKSVDTRPEMWYKMDGSEFKSHSLEDQYQLYRRLPESIETVIFHDVPKSEGREPSEVSIDQVKGLLIHRRAMLPNLRTFTIVVVNDTAVRHFEALGSMARTRDEGFKALDKVFDGIDDHEEPFEFHVHNRKPRQIFTKTIFDEKRIAGVQPHRKWTGTAYRNIKPRGAWFMMMLARIKKDYGHTDTSRIDPEALERIKTPAKNGELSDVESVESLSSENSFDEDYDHNNDWEYDFEEDYNGEAEYVRMHWSERYFDIFPPEMDGSQEGDDDQNSDVSEAPDLVETSI